MAEHRTATIDVDASAEELFEIVVDIENYPDWVQGVTGVEIHGRNDDGYPLQATMTVDAGVKTFTYRLEYDYDFPGLVSWKSVSGDLKQIDGSYGFDVNDEGGTTITYELMIDPGFRIPGFMVRQAQKAIMSAALDGLKDRAES